MIKSSFTSTRTNPSGRALSISDFSDAIGGLFAASCRSGTTTTADCAKLYQGSLVIKTRSTRNCRFNHSLGRIGRYDTAACADAHSLRETNDIICILRDISGLDEENDKLTWDKTSSRAHLAISPKASRSQDICTSRLQGLLRRTYSL